MIRLAGQIIGEPQFSHEFMGEKFYDVKIESSRLSGACDTIPCIVPELFIDNFNDGEKICVSGEIRTHNANGKVRVEVFVKELYEYEKDENDVRIDCAYICKKPAYRETPLGRHIADLIVAVNRKYGKSDYIPCITWGRGAEYISMLEPGQKISIVGRFQSREYVKRHEDGTEETKTAYELSINSYKEVHNDGE